MISFGGIYVIRLVSTADCRKNKLSIYRSRGGKFDRRDVLGSSFDTAFGQVFFKKMCVRHAIRKNVRHLINGPLNALEATTIRLDLVIISNVIIADTRNLLGEEVRK